VSRWDDALVADVEALMQERLAGLLSAGERLAVRGESSAQEERARFELAPGPQGEKVVLESRVEKAGAQLGADEARDLALDALDLVLLEYLESGRSLRFSGVEEPRELRGEPVAVRGERTFPALEEAADRLLDGDGDADA